MIGQIFSTCILSGAKAGAVKLSACDARTLWYQAFLRHQAAAVPSKKASTFVLAFIMLWCPGEDSNLHASQR